MAPVFRIVNRLLHGAQQHGLQHFRVRTIADGFQQLGVIAWLRLITARQLQTEFSQHGAERGYGLRGWLVVNTEQRRLFGFLNETCRRDVRQDHTLFNQLVRIVTLSLFDTLDTTLSVKDKLRLFTLKRDPTALFARLIQRFVEVVQLFDVFDQRRVLFAKILIALQHMPDLGIGQARMRTHHRFVELIARQTSLAGDGHFADHTQAVHLRVEGTQAVGEHFWQHRYNLRREVDRRTAAARFVIQRRVRTHVIAHIRDSHPQTPAATAFFLAIYGIIEVTGVFTINGDQRQIAQIHAACFGLFRHFFTQVFNLIFNRFRPDIRNFMGTQRHIDGHAGAHVIAQHFDDFTHRFGATGWALGEFHHHHKAHACAHHLFRRDENVEAQTAVVRHHKAYARIGKVTAYNLAGFRHQHADHARFAAAFTVCTQRLRQDLVAVNTHLHLFG